MIDEKLLDKILRVVDEYAPLRHDKIVIIKRTLRKEGIFKQDNLEHAGYLKQEITMAIRELERIEFKWCILDMMNAMSDTYEKEIKRLKEKNNE